MLQFVLRRLGLSVLTILGVMVVTFLLFRVTAGDIASAHTGEKATEDLKADWRHRHGYDRPLFLNVHRQLLIVDHTEGEYGLAVEDGEGSEMVGKLALIPSDTDSRVRMGKYVFRLSEDTPIEKLMPPQKEPPGGKNKRKRLEPNRPAIMVVKLNEGSSFSVDIGSVRTCGELMQRINEHPQSADPATNSPRVRAKISDLHLAGVFETQFVDHLYKSATFQSVSLVHKEKLTDIIVERAPKSLSLTVPSMAMGWLLGMIVACLVAYFHNTLLDRLGVFLSVLGMCIPYLAWLIYGQWLMFVIAPEHAYGLGHRGNVYLPILIMTIAGLGGSVRFYRTVILDEVGRDYVRTARAKGAPLTSVLFRHVLKNCMLPILTNLIMAIPFLIMGSLLAETFFGIPGLGDLMISSIAARDEPVLSGLVFLTALIYTVGILLTDLSYALFDPRIRLR